MSKAEVGLMWQELIKGDKQGEELMDPALIEEIHAKLAHLTSETEVFIWYSIWKLITLLFCYINSWNGPVIKWEVI